MDSAKLEVLRGIYEKALEVAAHAAKRRLEEVEWLAARLAEVEADSDGSP